MTSYYIYMLICSFSPSFTLLWPHISHSGINYGHFSIRRLIIPFILTKEDQSCGLFIPTFWEFQMKHWQQQYFTSEKNGCFFCVFHIALAYDQLIKTTTEMSSFYLNSSHISPNLKDCWLKWTCSWCACTFIDLDDSTFDVPRKFAA